jgi:translation initiation factor 2B subunit (eIF-2B alpha/beta/delta family)
MKNLLPKNVAKIIRNNSSGSTEILLALHEHLKREQKIFSIFPEMINLTKKKFPAFQNVQTYLDEMSKSMQKKKSLNSFFDYYDKIFQNNLTTLLFNARKILKPYSSFLTISNSSTVYEVLKELKKSNKKIKVYAAESRPVFEGRILAKKLAKSNIEVQVITEAMISEFLKKSDAAIIGTDKILKCGDVINKIGSLPLAILCREFNKPLYVIADRSKFSKGNIFKQSEMPPWEIWRHHPKNISVKNFYFERVDKKFLTRIISD